MIYGSGIRSPGNRHPCTQLHPASEHRTAIPEHQRRSKVQSHHLPHFRFTPWCWFVPPHTSGSRHGAGLSRPTPQAHAMVPACPAPHFRFTPWCWFVPPHTSGSRHGVGLFRPTPQAHAMVPACPAAHVWLPHGTVTSRLTPQLHTMTQAQLTLL